MRLPAKHTLCTHRYHLWLGVSKIYIFDHASQPPLSIEVQDFVRAGKVRWVGSMHWHQLASSAATVLVLMAPPRFPATVLNNATAYKLLLAV